MILTVTDNCNVVGVERESKKAKDGSIRQVFLRWWWCGCGHVERCAKEFDGEGFDPRRGEWLNANMTHDQATAMVAREIAKS